MRKALLAAALLLASSAAAADSGIRRTPCGYQQITTLSSATALTIPTTLCAANTVTFAVITAEAQAVRYRDDGTAPSATVGQPLAVGVALEYAGALSRIKFFEQTSGAKLNVTYYK